MLDSVFHTLDEVAVRPYLVPVFGVFASRVAYLVEKGKELAFF